MIRLLAKSIREYKRDALLTPLFVTLEVIIECILPFLTANLVWEIQTGCELSTILTYGIILIVLAGFSLYFGRIAGITAASASAGYAKNLRQDMFYNIQKFSFANIDRFSTSSLVTRMTTDVTNVQMAFMMIIRGAIRFPLMLVFSFIMAFIMGGSMAFIFLFTIPVLAIGLAIIICKVHPLFVKVFRKYDTLNNSIQENVQAMRVVKSYVREDFEKEKFSAAAEDVCRDFTRAERIMAFNSPLMQFCLYSATCLILGLGAYFIISTQGVALTVGKLSSLFIYSFQILVSLMMLSMVFVMITISAESAHRIVEVLQERSTITSPGAPVMEVKDGSIDFDGVDFKYSEDAERNALSQIDLHIRSGETVGILGGTGSSKSSLIQHIPRLYDATQGTVRVGGIDVRDYDLDTLRNAVAVVLQKNVLFSGTIKENLRWGNPDATDEELLEACRLAQADEFIQLFPDKYDTYLERGGVNVSGGQKQRLCIARALLKKPKILILDDSTSAVDTKTDALIRKAFREFIPDTTKIIVAQRVASVQEADRILIMDGGRIVAMGSHDELLKSSPIYQEVYESQNKGGQEDEA
ncbi:ABC transporter ATP-binding protein [Pseudoflavonifractor capillosus]|uniref:ABC transporter ATP-binding protein n=1 Tax=Pseudoflavonifractor capillosus TaxID=106588 RepID=UPI00195D43B1|nr:ABC transporter ATP-binding protein [Pseudoflavonifractor capillosus]MBM6897957.1 ABC transporter ATP-binding protein [Pseudoflavonifractor capillosus]